MPAMEVRKRPGGGPAMRCALAVGALSAFVGSQEPGITWKGADRFPQDLAEAAPQAAKAVDEWSAFAAATGSRFVLGDDARILMVLGSTFEAPGSRKEHREVEVMLELVAQTAEVVDRWLGPPEDEAGTAVVVCARREHYPALLEHMATLDGRLASWAGAEGRLVAGFILSQPNVAAWIEDPEGVEEWHPYNELVHRAAQLLIRQRAPHVPDWLLLGLAWHVEDTVRASVYCFPHRTGFVSALSHTDWGRWLSNEFKKSRRRMRDKPPVLEVDEFATWQPHIESEFEVDAAYISFGVARFLVRHHPERIAPLLTRWSQAIEKGQKVWVSETEWTTNPDYRLPSNQQLAALEEIHPGFLEAATRFFQEKGAVERLPPRTGSKHW